MLKKLSGNNEIQEIPPIIYNNDILYDDKLKAEAFNNYFNKISTLNLENEPALDFGNIFIHSEFELDFLVTEQEVEDQLKLLNTNKAYGCDKISPHLLRINCENICKSLHSIFNASLDYGIFPDSWEKSHGFALA